MIFLVCGSGAIPGDAKSVVRLEDRSVVERLPGIVEVDPKPNESNKASSIFSLM